VKNSREFGIQPIAEDNNKEDTDKESNTEEKNEVWVAEGHWSSEQWDKE
jgi:hypothetical protein